MDADKLKADIEKKILDARGAKPMPGVGAQGVPGVGSPGVGAKAIDPEALKRDAENRKQEMFEQHIKRIQDQIDSKKPGDPAIAILEKIVADMKQKMLEDDTVEEQDQE